MGELTDLQREILEAKRDDPNVGPKEIADQVDCSEGYARDILNEYDTAHLDADARTVSTDESSSSKSSGNSGLLRLILLPFYLAYWTLEISLKMIWAILAIFFGILKTILPPYGGS